MRSIAKKITSVLLAAALVPAVALSPSLASADPAEDPRYDTALDEALNLVHVSEDSQNERWFVNEAGYVQFINRGLSSGTQTLSDLPESYTAPYTEIKNQGQAQSCWAFAVIGSLESATLKQQGASAQVSAEPNYAEAQVVYGAFNGRTEDGKPDGKEVIASDNDHLISADRETEYGNLYGYWTPGNWALATGALAAGRGISNEETFSSDAFDAPAANTEEEFYQALAGNFAQSAESVAVNYDSSELRLNRAVSLPEPTPVTGSSDDGSKAERPWNDESSMAAVQELKQAIYDQGAFNFLYYVEYYPSYYHVSPREEDPSYPVDEYYYSPNYWIYDADDVNGEGTESRQVNHVVLAVGWDDTYSRWNFATPLLNDDGTEKVYDDDIATVEEYKGTQYIVPKGDGAWVMKNSYGTSMPNAEGESLKMGDDGIFYLSYYEKTITMPSVMVPEDTTDLENPHDPESGTLAYEETKLLGRYGWFTLPLNETVAIDANSTYSVVVSLTDGSDVAYQVAERPYVYAAQLFVGKGESFLKMKTGNEETWVDMADIAAEIKGETGDGEAAGDPVGKAADDSAGEVIGDPADEIAEGTTVRDSSDPATIVQNGAVGNLTIKAFSNPVQEPVGPDDPDNPDDPGDKPAVPSEDAPSGNNQQSDNAGSSDNKEGLPHTGDFQVAIPLTLSVLFGSAAMSLIARRKSKVR